MSTSRGLRLAGGTALAAAGALLALGWARKNLVVVTVSGTSMVPTLQDGDRVLVRRRPLAHVRRGDVVVLEPPLDGPYLPGPAGPDGRIWNVKRAAALPGDELPPGIPNAPNTFEAPSTPAASGGTDASGGTAEDVPREVRAVPPGTLAVLGDNPDSIDSRHRGLFSGDRLLGVVVRRLNVTPRPSQRPEAWQMATRSQDV
ncbi:S26 family signal peptidase [Actinomadura bangladeshensis]|uniref:Signal peptidase I n=2 Tax=Actinomadura bangladeshensis TaxID=453573 RepID=A0A4R4NX71_9ACTN|nr:signal peptidase I [Actinomadura bangladeshensis]